MTLPTADYDTIITGGGPLGLPQHMIWPDKDTMYCY